MNPQLAASATWDVIEDSECETRRSDVGKGIEHARWMLTGIIEGYVQHEKAHRWLGYAQAILVAEEECCTLETMKEINARC